MKRLTLVLVTILFISGCDAINWLKYGDRGHAYGAEVALATKIDENTIAVEKVVPEVRTRVKLERGELEKKKATLKIKKQGYIARIDKEIAEIDSYLAECDRLGIVGKDKKKVDFKNFGKSTRGDL